MFRFVKPATRSLTSAILIAVIAVGPAAAQDSAATDKDESGVVAAALDYMEGALTADADRVGRGVPHWTTWRGH
jgi:hypothetical protein